MLELVILLSPLPQGVFWGTFSCLNLREPKWSVHWSLGVFFPRIAP